MLIMKLLFFYLFQNWEKVCFFYSKLRKKLTFKYFKINILRTSQLRKMLILNLSTSKLQKKIILKQFKVKVCSRCLSLTSGDQDSLSQSRRYNSHQRKSSHKKTCTSLTSLHPSVTHILTSYCTLVIRPLFLHLLLSTVTGVRNLKTLW